MPAQKLISMSRKILIYGFAFASLICLSTFIYFENGMYKSFWNDMIIGRITPIIVLIVGIWLLIKSLKKSTKFGLSIGRIGFSGMLFTAVVCIVWPVFFYAYTQKKPNALPAVKEAILDRRMAFYEQNKEEITEKELEETKKNLDTVFTQKMQIRATIFMLFSMGILASSGLALLMGRNPKEIANDMDQNA